MENPRESEEKVPIRRSSETCVQPVCSPFSPFALLHLSLFLHLHFLLVIEFDWTLGQSLQILEFQTLRFLGIMGAKMWIMNVEDTDDYFFTVHRFVFSFFFWNERFIDFCNLLTQFVYYSLVFFLIYYYYYFFFMNQRFIDFGLFYFTSLLTQLA